MICWKVIILIQLLLQRNHIIGNSIYISSGMAEFICPDCGKRLYHENETTLEIEKGVHKKFCTKTPGAVKSFMHRGPNDNESIAGQRANDDAGKPILKR